MTLFNFVKPDLSRKYHTNTVCSRTIETFALWSRPHMNSFTVEFNIEAKGTR